MGKSVVSAKFIFWVSHFLLASCSDQKLFIKDSSNIQEVVLLWHNIGYYCEVLMERNLNKDKKHQEDHKITILCLSHIHLGTKGEARSFEHRGSYNATPNDLFTSLLAFSLLAQLGSFLMARFPMSFPLWNRVPIPVDMCALFKPYKVNPLPCLQIYPGNELFRETQVSIGML